MKRLLYQLLALSNDVNAVCRGRVGRRITDVHGPLTLTEFGVTVGA